MPLSPFIAYIITFLCILHGSRVYANDLLAAIRCGNLREVRWCVERRGESPVDICVDDDEPKTPLRCAVEARQPDIVGYLMKQGATTTVTGLELHLAARDACYTGNLDLLDILHKNGAHIDQGDEFGFDALCTVISLPVVLSEANRNKVIFWLLHNGANPLRVIRENYTALDLALDTKRLPMIHIIVNRICYVSTQQADVPFSPSNPDQYALFDPINDCIEKLEDSGMVGLDEQLMQLRRNALSFVL